MISINIKIFLFTISNSLCLSSAVQRLKAVQKMLEKPELSMYDLQMIKAQVLLIESMLNEKIYDVDLSKFN